MKVAALTARVVDLQHNSSQQPAPVSGRDEHETALINGTIERVSDRLNGSSGCLQRSNPIIEYTNELETCMPINRTLQTSVVFFLFDHIFTQYRPINIIPSDCK